MYLNCAFIKNEKCVVTCDLSSEGAILCFADYYGKSINCTPFVSFI